MKKSNKLLQTITLATIFLAVFIGGCKDSGTGADDSDTQAPAVMTTSPTIDAVDIAHNINITITFSEEMDASTINATTFTLKQGTASIAGAVTYSSSIATFAPSSLLEENLVYTATITTGAKDLAGNSLAANVVWNFTAASNPDTQAPTVMTTSPTTNEVNVERNKVVEITFSEEMDASTINTASFTLKQNGASVEGEVSYSNTRATFTSTGTLDAALTYTAKITTNVSDLAGNKLAADLQWSFTTSGQSEPLATVDLGTAANYVILAKSAISNIPTSSITGDLGISPAAETFITGFSLTNATGYSTSSQVTGQVFAADMADPTPINLTTAVNNMQTAYTDAAGRPSPDFFELYTGDISGKTLTRGLYKWTNTVTLSSDVTLSGGADAIWIFQIDGDLSMSSAVNITLIGGAQTKNIFWQVAGEVIVGTTSHFEGIILSKTGITLQKGASMNGRALAQTAVTLDGNSVVKPQ
tara:strand:+ start:3772 stop:5187 length:1416 start_codon:yes stop_codon:yes gene_type:complete